MNNLIKNNFIDIQNNKNWEKEWDKLFKDILSKHVAVKIGTKGYNFNEYAKRFIHNLLIEQKKRLFKTHNILALSSEKTFILENENKKTLEYIDNVVEKLNKSNKESQEIVKILNKLKNKKFVNKSQ